MNGPENLWESLGAIGSAASVVGVAIAIWAEARARSAERRAKSAEEKVDAAVTRTRTAGNVRGLAVAYTAARLALSETSSRPAWAAHVAQLRGELGAVCESPTLSAADRREAQRIAASLTDLTHRDPRSDRTLGRAADMIDRLNARSLRRLTEPER